MALGVDLYEPNASSSELARGYSGLINKHFLLNRIKVVLSTMWAQLQRRHMAYGYMGYGAMYNLGTNFLVAKATLKPPFFALNAETGFLRFKT
jgi:hypothetical protein